MRARRYDRGEDAAGDAVDGGGATHHEEFGFVTVDRTHTLRSFAAYADWVKALHFSDPPPKVGTCTCLHIAYSYTELCMGMPPSVGLICVWTGAGVAPPQKHNVTGVLQSRAQQHAWSVSGLQWSAAPRELHALKSK